MAAGVHHHKAFGEGSMRPLKHAMLRRSAVCPPPLPKPLAGSLRGTCPRFDANTLNNYNQECLAYFGDTI